MKKTKRKNNSKSLFSYINNYTHENECLVCMGTITGIQGIVILPCNCKYSVYHTGCLNVWFCLNKNINKCPYCKKKYYLSENYFTNEQLIRELPQYTFLKQKHYILNQEKLNNNNKNLNILYTHLISNIFFNLMMCWIIQNYYENEYSISYYLLFIKIINNLANVFSLKYFNNYYFMLVFKFNIDSYGIVKKIIIANNIFLSLVIILIALDYNNYIFFIGLFSIQLFNMCLNIYLRKYFIANLIKQNQQINPNLYLTN